MKQSGIEEQLSPERRRFLEICGRYGFTTAVLGSIGGYLWSDDAIAQTAADEEAKQKAAKFTMLFATEYKTKTGPTCRSRSHSSRRTSKHLRRTRSI